MLVADLAGRRTVTFGKTLLKRVWADIIGETVRGGRTRENRA